MHPIRLEDTSANFGDIRKAIFRPVPARRYLPSSISTWTLAQLVAELGAAFLCAKLGITVEPRPDHAQYLTHWLSVLKVDKRAIFTAASKAAEAVAFLHDARQP